VHNVSPFLEADYLITFV